jgi:hypothetical protein
MSRLRVASAVLASSFALLLASSACAYDQRFDVATYNCTPEGSEKHFCLPQLNHLNFVTTNGHLIGMGSDTYRSTINTNGNFLTAYFNDLTSLYGVYNGTEAAAFVEDYINTYYTTTGVKTTWVVINEISTSLWPSSQAYRDWVRTMMYQLKTTYGHKVILFSPFATLSGNDTDWSALAGNVYIAAENYLSGAEINSHGNSVSWCQAQYQTTMDSYPAHGVPRTKLFLAETYAHTVAGTNWGRAGVSYAGWDNAIKARATAMHNIGFAGVIGYGWGYDGMGVSEAEMIHFEDTYASKVLP